MTCPVGEPEELDEVCGCNCGCAALSATCWVERLLSRPDARLERRVCEHPALFSISADLLRVVSRRDGNPFALSRLLGLGAFLPLLLQPPHASSLGREAWSFLAFGLRQFDNQSFVEARGTACPSARLSPLTRPVRLHRTACRRSSPSSSTVAACRPSSSTQPPSTSSRTSPPPHASSLPPRPRSSG